MPIGDWRQMVADVFGLPVELPQASEGAAFGAALQALWASESPGSQADLQAIAREHDACANQLFVVFGHPPEELRAGHLAGLGFGAAGD